MIGIRKNIITVKDLYDYALLHNYINSDANIVLDIINRERNPRVMVVEKEESIVNPINNTSTIDFSKVEYTINDVLALFNT